MRSIILKSVAMGVLVVACRDGTCRVWVRVEPSHTLTRRSRYYPSLLPIPVKGYNFFPYLLPDRVDGYLRVKILMFRTYQIEQKIVVKTTHNSSTRDLFVVLLYRESICDHVNSTNYDIRDN